MRDKIAIIGSGYQARVFANRAKELNIETHCFSWDKKDAASNLVDYFHEINIFDVDKIIEVCKEFQISGVLATTELTILPAAQIAERLSLNGNMVQIAKEITNKYVTRNKISDAKIIKQPQYWICENENIPQIDKFPVIVKPIAAGGKRGVHVVRVQSELENAIKAAQEFSKVQGALVEQYLDGGMECSVESLSYNGKHYIIQVTEKESSGPPRCVELGHHQPARISKDERKKVEKAVVEALELAGIENGPCHTEIKLIDGEVYLIEINGRPGGDHINYPLTELSTDYPYITGIIQVALNKFEGYEPKCIKNYYSGVCFVTDVNPERKPLFDKCKEYDWLYKKYQATNEPTQITFNDEFGINHFIYYSKKGRPEEI